MSVKLTVVAVLVAEHAVSTKHALLGVVEGPAVLRLELWVVTLDSIDGQLMLSVSISTLVLVATFGRLNPVFAQFSLRIAICVSRGDALSHTLGLWRRWARSFDLGALGVTFRLLSLRFFTLNCIQWSWWSIVWCGLENWRGRDKCRCLKGGTGHEFKAGWHELPCLGAVHVEWSLVHWLHLWLLIDGASVIALLLEIVLLGHCARLWDYCAIVIRKLRSRREFNISLRVHRIDSRVVSAPGARL